MTPEELVFNSITISPRGAYISNPQYYERIALLERNRQWNIAKAYMQTVGGISLPLLLTDPLQFYKNKFGQ